MGPIQVVVEDGNNLVLEVTPTPDTTVILDRGIAGPPGPAGSGDVDGPASSTDNAVARFDGTTGKLIQNSVVTINDAGALAGVTDLSLSGSITLSGGVANSVPYLNGSKVLTTGSALTFDGKNLLVGSTTSIYNQVNRTAFEVNGTATSIMALNAGGVGQAYWYYDGAGVDFYALNGSLRFGASGSEQMRLTSTGLGIGTSSPWAKLSLAMSNGQMGLANGNTSGGVKIQAWNAAGNADGYLAFEGYTKEYGRFDSSGNLGLGVTPSAWGSGGQLQLAGGNIIAYSNASGWLVANSYYNGGWRYISTGASTQYLQDLGAHKWYTAPSGTAGDAISFTQAMTLDASGNWMVGVTSPYGVSGGGTTRGTVALDTAGRVQLAVSNQSSSSSAGAALALGAYGSDWIIEAGSAAKNSNALTFSNGAERARIDASGNLLVGTTDASATSGVGTKLIPNGQYYGVMSGSTNADTTFQLYSTGAGAYRFYVGLGGTVYATSTTISAISDQRLKENVQDLDVGLDKIMALKPRKFDWKAGKGKDIKGDRGWVAQEFEQVFPDMIDTWKDEAPEGEEPYKSVRAELIPVLVKAIQEQQAIIATLTARVAALESSTLQ